MIGSEEIGNLRVSQISPRFNEDILVGQDLIVARGVDIPADVNFYWEVFFPQTGADGIRRRFTPKSAPSLKPTAFEWTIDLMRASEDRTRSGELR